MKKSLIALAVAGAFATPAFAATSNVDIYGKLHVSVGFYDDLADQYEDVQVSSNASRIGFKGSEDLGGGLKGIWQIESGINLDEQNGSWANRNSFVGLAGGWGTALIGNHDTPLKLVGRAVDLFGDTIADSRNVMGGGSDTRAQNVVAYISPSFSGFSFAAAYTNDLSGAGAVAGTSPVRDSTGALTGDYVVTSTTTTTNGDDADASAFNLNATYANGPLYIGVGYGDGDAHEALGLDAHWRVAAGYTFGNFKAVGQYDSLEGDGVTGDDYDAWMIGGSYTMGAMVFKANYMEGEIDGCNVAGCDLEQWTVGMDYNLSKRTAVYALYADGQNITLGGGAGTSDRISGYAVTGDEDISAFSLGVTHSF